MINQQKKCIIYAFGSFQSFIKESVEHFLLFLLLKVSELAGFLWYNDVGKWATGCCFVLSSQIAEGDKLFRCILMFSFKESENEHCVSMLSVLLGFLIVKTLTRQWLRGWWCLLFFFFLLFNRWATCFGARAPPLTFLTLACFLFFKPFWGKGFWTTFSWLRLVFSWLEKCIVNLSLTVQGKQCLELKILLKHVVASLGFISVESEYCGFFLLSFVSKSAVYRPILINFLLTKRLMKSK